jgi:hypothetical protein
MIRRRRKIILNSKRNRRNRRNEGVLGSGGIAPAILDLGTRWR